MGESLVLFALLLPALLAISPPLWCGPRDVVINEVHYNVFAAGQEERGEFVELFNGGATAVRLDGWSFTRGIDFTFAGDVVLPPKAYLIVCPDVDEAIQRYALDAWQVAGPFVGRLENNGEVIELVDENGEYINRVHFGDGTPWSGRPDGRGPSLEFTGIDNGNDIPHRWKPSLVIDGSPGRRNTRPVAEEVVIPVDDSGALVPERGTWRVFPGESDPSDPLDAWTQVDFDDDGWNSAVGGFGFGVDHGFIYSTELAGMRFSYSTFFVRGSFTLDAETLAQIQAEDRLTLDVSYDDGFVAYLNGQEVARSNLGTEGEPVEVNTRPPAARAESVEIDLSEVDDILREGDNVLALVGANRRAGNGDFFLGAELRADLEKEEKPVLERTGLPYIGGVLNELRSGTGDGDRGVIELYNPTEFTLDFTGHVILSSAGDFVHEILQPVVLEPGAFFVLDSGSLRSVIPGTAAKYILLEPDGKTIVDDVLFAPLPGLGTGRFPDGDDDVWQLDEPSPGAPNSYSFDTPVVINEINFHPPFVAADKGCPENCSDRNQWLELFNRSEAAVDLSGWRLTRGVRFDFAKGQSIPPGGFLVVASDVDAFQALHPGVENVVGGWSGRLNHATETINLRDALGNRVDRVQYGDGKPLNDESPDDGVDDATFRGSAWPSRADGDGPTLELRHPDLGNRAGMAWRASAEALGTPGAVNSAFDADVPPAIRDVDHSPAVPRSGEPVVVTCQITSVRPLGSAVVSWAVDGADASGAVPLFDDGNEVDEVAGDGVFSGVIPPQRVGRVVRFRIEAEDSAGQTSSLPLQPTESPYEGFPGVFFLYEVDNDADPSFGSPVYRIVMTASDLNELEDRPLFSNVLLPATFIADGEVFHTVGVRYRGENSRRENNRSYKVRFPSERSFDGIDNLNMNAGNGGPFGVRSFNELLAIDLYRRAGAPYPMSHAITLHFPGEVGRDFDRRYIRKESYDSDFLDRFFGASDNGFFYRPRNPGGPGSPSGDLRYRGEDVEEYRAIYEKRNHGDEDDFSDVIDLTRLFDPEQTPNDVFVEQAEELIDARQWAQFFAVMSCVTNTDGGIWNNNGEDYFIYRMPFDSPMPNAGKWLLLAWDLEETFTGSTEELFRPTVPSIVRFLSQPEFARLYYDELLKVRDGPFSRAEIRSRFGHADQMFAAADVYDVVDEADTTITRRLGYYDDRVSRSLEGGATEDSGLGGTVVVEVGDDWRFFRGNESPPASWVSREFDDSAWEAGPSGLGYDDGDDATILDDMQGNYSTLYARRMFEIADPAGVGGLVLQIDYDDAFVAYVNGVEIARSPNAPGDEPVPFDAIADDNHESARGTRFERYDGVAAIDDLVAGTNVLAVVGINGSLDSSDFSLIPRLSYTESDDERGPAGGCGADLFVEGDRLILRGLADPVSVYSVFVDGEPAQVGLVRGGDGPYGATWSAEVDGLAVGANIVTVTSLDENDDVVSSVDFDITRIDGAFQGVNGELAGDTTWTAEEGPYRLVGNLDVPEGVTLTIDPGVVVLVSEDASIFVSGSLQAVGTEDAPILIRSWACDAAWGGIAFSNTGTGEGAVTHLLRHCEIQGGESPVRFDGIVAPVGSRLRVESCALENLFENAIDASDSYLEVIDCRFENILEGVHATNSTVIVRGCFFDNMKGNSDAIDFDGSGTERSVIADSFFGRSSDDGVDLGSVTVDIRDNIFVDIGDKAISMEVPGDQGNPTITGNLIVHCGTGMAIKDGIRVSEGHHNTIVGCVHGIDLFAKDQGPSGGDVEFHSTIVWGNTFDVTVDSRSSAEFTYSNIAGVEVWPGDGNILADPRFVDLFAGDFHLAKDSPCIGTGDGGTDMGAVPSGNPPPPPSFVRGDVDGSGLVNLTDAVAALDWLFRGGAVPSCHDRADANDDGEVNLTDGIYTLLFLFAGGDGIPAPFPEPGIDPTDDGLPCR